MVKTQEELNALKEEVETVSKKLHELTDEELEQVSGGAYYNNGEGNPTYIPGNTYIYDNYENGGIAPEDKRSGR